MSVSTYDISQVQSPEVKSEGLLSLIITPGWTWETYSPYQPGRLKPHPTSVAEGTIWLAWSYWGKRRVCWIGIFNDANELI
jgi:hypothetical protein